MQLLKRSVVALCLGVVSLAATAAGTINKVESVDIENYSLAEGSTGFAGSTVGFGGATRASAMKWLQREGFTTVINLRLASEEGVDIEASRAAAEAAGLNYIHLPFDKDNPDLTVVEDFLATVSDSANQPVYTHCSSATRAAALWMIGRVLKDGLDIDAASKEVEMMSPKPAEAIAFATMYIDNYPPLAQ